MANSGKTKAPPELAVAERLPEIGTVRMLLVDDDPQAQVLIEMALADAAFECCVEVVPTARQGLRRVFADEHDIYVVDQQLPDGTGVSIIHEAKSRGVHKPFILLTAYGSGALDEEASREGAADYVEKHMVSAHLERSIRYALRTWQASRQLHDRDEQLRQAQKIEAIGRLAGGVAHDFNNLLTAIIGYTDMITERLPPTDPTRRDIDEIRKAADRAAALTRQLLAFGRKQLLNPTVLDLNEVASGILQMLPRVIGEHIRTDVSLAPDLWRVRADASQMEQVLVNLVLNARDAMPKGGNLRIETANVTLPEPARTDDPPLGAGRYVMLAVSDTGIGMDAATRAHAFEPFFTTKPKGKGTGLGLSTVYGIVNQSGGAVTIDTAPRRGTSVRAYLPATRAAAPLKPARPPATRDYGGHETVLLVEDNDAVRALAAKALRRRGYTVQEARNAEDAIAWASTAGGRPQLLVTDVIMPGLSGPGLASRLLELHPTLRVLYMSGYMDDATALRGGVDGASPLLQKPFSPSTLAEQVRLALDR